MRKPMTLEVLLTALVRFRDSFNDRFSIGEPSSYMVNQRWFSVGESQIPNAGTNRVYIYASVDGEILYIGKSERATGDGIGYRSCAHLGRAIQGGELMFPAHDWVDSEVRPDIRQLIGTGNFVIWTIPISPNHFVSLTEVFMQTMYFDSCSAHPPLNRKFG